MLGTGKSFRTNRDSDLIREGLDLATVGGDAVVRAGSIRIACTIARGSRGTRKRYSVNDAPVRYARFLGSIKVVTFVPSDLQLVVGAPGLRRGFINVALAQEDPRYYRALARYQKTVQQKSALLRSEDVDADLLEILRSGLDRIGNGVDARAQALRGRVGARSAANARARWSDDAERLDVAYAPSVAFETPSEDGIAAAFEARLAAVAPAERARGAAAGRTASRRPGTVARRALAGRLRFARTASHGGTRAQGCRIHRHARTRRPASSALARRRALRTGRSTLVGLLSGHRFVRAGVRNGDASPGRFCRRAPCRANDPQRRRSNRNGAMLKTVARRAGGLASRRHDRRARRSGRVFDRALDRDRRKRRRTAFDAVQIVCDALLIVARSGAWSQQLTFLEARILEAGFSAFPARENLAPALPRRAVNVRAERPQPPRAPRPGAAPKAASAAERRPSVSPKPRFARFREDVVRRERAKRSAGWKECSGCGALIAPVSRRAARRARARMADDRDRGLPDFCTTPRSWDTPERRPSSRISHRRSTRRSGAVRCGAGGRSWRVPDGKGVSREGAASR